MQPQPKPSNPPMEKPNPAQDFRYESPWQLTVGGARQPEESPSGQKKRKLDSSLPPSLPNSDELPTTSPKTILDLWPHLVHFSKQHQAEIHMKDKEIASLSAEVARLHDLQASNEDEITQQGATTAQETSQLRAEVQRLRKQKETAEARCNTLQVQLTNSQHSQATSTTTAEISSLKEQVQSLNRQAQVQAKLIDEYMGHWKNSEALREELKATLDQEHRHVQKLTKEVKSLAEDLKKERQNGSKARYENAKAVVCEIMAIPSVKSMAAGESFGEVGKAFKKLDALAASMLASDSGSSMEL